MSFCDIQFKRNKDSIEVTNKSGYPSKLYPKIVEKVKPQSNVVYQNGKSFFDTLIEQGKLMNNNPDELSLGLYSLAYNSDKTERYWIDNINDLLPKSLDNYKELSSKYVMPEDKIIFGHPGLGKTYAKELGLDIIDFDTDYKKRINEVNNLEPGWKVRNEWRKTNENLWNQTVRQLWNEAKEESKKTGKPLLASDMILLREFPNDFDKVITMSKETLIERSKQRDDYKEGDTENWKEKLDIAIQNVNSDKVIYTTKYMSELFLSKENQHMFKSPKLKRGSGTNVANTKASDVLQDLATNGLSRDIRLTAKRLLDSVSKNDAPILDKRDMKDGELQYNLFKNEIYVNAEQIKTVNPEDYQRGILHEIIHSLTINPLISREKELKSSTFFKEIKQVVSDLEKRVPTKEKDNTKFYAFQHADEDVKIFEFIAEYLSKKEFADWVDARLTNKKSFIEKLVAFIANVIFGKKILESAIFDYIENRFEFIPMSKNEYREVLMNEVSSNMSNINFRKPNITLLPNGNLKIIAFRTDKSSSTSKGQYQRGKGLYLSLNEPYPGEEIYTVEIEISPESLLDRKLGLGKISEDYFINEKNKRKDKRLDTLHEFKQSLGIKAEIASIDGALLNELVLYDMNLINSALISKKPYTLQQDIEGFKRFVNRESVSSFVNTEDSIKSDLKKIISKFGKKFGKNQTIIDPNADYGSLIKSIASINSEYPVKVVELYKAPDGTDRVRLIKDNLEKAAFKVKEEEISSTKKENEIEIQKENTSRMVDSIPELSYLSDDEKFEAERLLQSGQFNVYCGL